MVVTVGADCTLVQALKDGEDGDDSACGQLRQRTGVHPVLLLAARRLSLLGVAHDLAESDAGSVAIPEHLTGTSP